MIYITIFFGMVVFVAIRDSEFWNQTINQPHQRQEPPVCRLTRVERLLSFTVIFVAIIVACTILRQ